MPQTQDRLLDYSRKAFELFFRREFEADRPDAVAALIENLGMSAQAYRDYFEGAGVEAYDTGAGRSRGRQHLRSADLRVRP